MVVCHCAAINDQRIRELIDESTTVADIIAECGAGGRCGGCVVVIEGLLEQQAVTQVALPMGASV